MEGHQRTLRPDIDLGDIGLDRLVLDLDQLDEIGGGSGEIAEAVDHLSRQRVDFGLVLRIVETAIKRHAHREVGDVILGDHDRRIDGDLRADAFGLGFQPQFARLGGKDRILQHRLVEFEPDLADVA